MKNDLGWKLFGKLAKSKLPLELRKLGRKILSIRISSWWSPYLCGRYIVQNTILYWWMHTVDVIGKICWISSLTVFWKCSVDMFGCIVWTSIKPCESGIVSSKQQENSSQQSAKRSLSHTTLYINYWNEQTNKQIIE